MFQAKTRGWKRIAASLVLLPGLTAVGAEMLHLLGTTQAQDSVNSRPVAPMKTATKEDPRALVKRARDAADSGRLDTAFDLAQQAEVNGRTTDWGLFEDTPEKVLKDIQKARGRIDRQKAERLVSQARALFERRAADDEHRAANLDKARSMCVEAIHLQGPSSMWYFGDRPESLIKDIDKVRSKINVAVRPANPDSAPGTRSASRTDVRVADSQASGPGNLPAPRNEDLAPLARNGGAAINPSPAQTALNPNQAPATPAAGQSGVDTVPPPEGDGLGGGTVVSRPFRKGKSPVIDSGAVVPLPQQPDPVVNVAGNNTAAPMLPTQLEPKPITTVTGQAPIVSTMAGGPNLITSPADAQLPPLPMQGNVEVQLPALTRRRVAAKAAGSNGTEANRYRRRSIAEHDPGVVRYRIPAASAGNSGEGAGPEQTSSR